MPLCLRIQKLHRWKKGDQKGQCFKADKIPKDATFDTVEVGCGKCHFCRSAQKGQWVTRLAAEAHCHDEACFITLTYATEHLPKHRELSRPDLRRFIETMRQNIERNFEKKIRFFAVGEYGDKGDRPHYHLLVFGHDFRDDRYPWEKGEGGSIQYRSPRLESMWHKGHVRIGDVTPRSIAYVASYTQKKMGGLEHQYTPKVFDIDFGEAATQAQKNRLRWTSAGFRDREPVFSTMSRDPGIGAPFFDQWKESIIAKGEFHLDGRNHFLPKYFRSLMSLEELIVLEENLMQKEEYEDGVGITERRKQHQTTERIHTRARLKRDKAAGAIRTL